MNEYIENEINNIKYEYDYGYNINKILDITEIIYKSNKEEKVRIFGYEFVNNNKENCKIIYNGKEFELKEYFNDIDEEYNNKNDIKIKLKGIHNVTNMSSMFSNCYKLSSLPDISNWDTKKVTNMNGMFCNCNKLISLPDISKWNTNNVTDMSNMFCNCTNLSSLPDISSWNIHNVKDMMKMFYNCNKLKNIPKFYQNN